MSTTLDIVKTDIEIRKEIDEMLIKSRTLSTPDFMTVLREIVRFAEERYNRQESLLNVLKTLNKK